MLAKFVAPVARAAVPAVRSHCRALSSKVDDVKIKDLPGYASQVAQDPKTRSAIEAAKFQYYQKYIKTGTADPIFHVIGVMMVCGYTLDWWFHLRHEANYKYH